MKHLVAAHHVARVAVAVQANDLVRGAGVNRLDPLEQVAGHRLEGRQQAFGDEVAFEQGIERGVAEVIHGQCFTVLERAGGADPMQTAEQLPKAIQLIEVARLWCTATAAREQGEAKAAVFEQGLVVVDKWRDHRHFAFGQFSGKAVLLEDRRVGPAVRAVELGDQWFSPFDTHLVDPVLVAVQCQHPGVAEKADAFHGVEDQVGGECFKGVGHARSCCAVPCMVSHIGGSCGSGLAPRCRHHLMCRLHWGHRGVRRVAASPLL
ncbi:hypothetical protein D3C80_879040 [compost metagenome]